MRAPRITAPLNLSTIASRERSAKNFVSSMDSYSKNSDKISDIVRLRQILKKWKRLATAPKTSTNNHSKGINKFLKKTLSFSDISSPANDGAVPKGFVAVCVGEELKRFVIPTEYLSHRAFELLLRQAEEEFGFEQEGVLKIPCHVAAFERVLKVVEEKKKGDVIGCCSSDCELAKSHHPQLCR